MHIRRTKIIATLGPASSSKEVIEKLIDAGANYFRLNFSHGTHETHLANIKLIREIESEKKTTTGILADLQGPKIRVGQIEGGGIDLKPGDTLAITTNPLVGNQSKVSTTYSYLPNDVKPDDLLLLDDGLLTFKVKSIYLKEDRIDCEVIFGGRLKSNKGINLPGVHISSPAFTEQDRENAIFSIEQDVDYFALSFVRNPEDIKPLKELIKQSGKDIPIIAKIESWEALENIDQIIQKADGLMVARGDLGVEILSEKVPRTQKTIIKKCNILGKPVITATQMLESMIQNATPTRAEVSDVANAILDGTDAVMLSGETAVGAYPVRAVQKMVDIAVEIEVTSPVLYSRRHGVNQFPENDIEEAIALSVCDLAMHLKSKSILAWTQSGRAIRLLSKFHPLSPIIALTNFEKIARRVQLSWGTLPQVISSNFHKEGDWASICNLLINNKMLGQYDLIVITERVKPYSKNTLNSLKVLDLSKCDL